MSDLRARVLSAVVLAAVILSATFFGAWAFALVTTITAVAVWNEWMDLAAPNGDDRLRPIGLMLLVGLFLISVIFPHGWLFFAWLAAIGVAATIARRLDGGKWATGGFVYAATAAVALIMLRYSPGSFAGLVALLFLFATVWATDIGAYFTGRRIGGPKVAPKISPNKTWSGAIGGVGAAILAGCVVFVITGTDDLASAILLAIVLSIVSQFGDFFESWVKRRNGVKDTSRMIPGHGGVMDRVDGLVAAAVALWLLCIVANGVRYPAFAFFA